jgi:hypothetical protein
MAPVHGFSGENSGELRFLGALSFMLCSNPWTDAYQVGMLICMDITGVYFSKNRGWQKVP